MVREPNPTVDRRRADLIRRQAFGVAPLRGRPL